MSFTKDSYPGELRGAALGISAMAQTAQPRASRIDSAANITANQVEQASMLANRLEGIAARLVGNADMAERGGAGTAPTPVRPSVLELEHRQEVLAQQLARIAAAITRIEDL